MSQPRAKCPKIGRGEDDYLSRNITEIELQNFMTFNHLKCKPGPCLNLVIGPNGSGKNSIVCAIALGLGGDGKAVPKKDVIDITQRFNIQINNLTQDMLALSGEKETLVSVNAPSMSIKEDMMSMSLETLNQSPRLDVMDLGNPKHDAALKLQKVYKSFRTRRKLADCTVLVEHNWWKVMDFAELKHSSISFFHIENHETAVSRWSRAKTRATKVGKGLSKNERAQKLALQHWLETIDPRHHYGHNLHFYYVRWFEFQS